MCNVEHYAQEKFNIVHIHLYTCVIQLANWLKLTHLDPHEHWRGYSHSVFMDVDSPLRTVWNSTNTKQRYRSLTHCRNCCMYWRHSEASQSANMCLPELWKVTFKLDIALVNNLKCSINGNNFKLEIIKDREINELEFPQVPQPSYKQVKVNPLQTNWACRNT